MPGVTLNTANIFSLQPPILSNSLEQLVRLAAAITHTNSGEIFVVNQDIKERNILMDRSTGNLTWIDFNIAHVFGTNTTHPASSSVSALLEETFESNILHGSPGHIPVEAIIDPSKHVHMRDPYAWMVTLRSVLAGDLENSARSPLSPSEAWDAMHTAESGASDLAPDFVDLLAKRLNDYVDRNCQLLALRSYILPAAEKIATILGNGLKVDIRERDTDIVTATSKIRDILFSTFGL